MLDPVFFRIKHECVAGASAAKYSRAGFPPHVVRRFGLILEPARSRSGGPATAGSGRGRSTGRPGRHLFYTKGHRSKVHCLPQPQNKTWPRMFMAGVLPPGASCPSDLEGQLFLRRGVAPSPPRRGGLQQSVGRFPLGSAKINISRFHRDRFVFSPNDLWYRTTNSGFPKSTVLTWPSRR
jgi:hypothetical protein